jgi:hypothetical protein
VLTPPAEQLAKFALGQRNVAENVEDASEALAEKERLLDRLQLR